MPQIQISDKFWKKLNSQKEVGETFEQVLIRLIEEGKEYYFKLEKDYLEIEKKLRKLERKKK